MISGYKSGIWIKGNLMAFGLRVILHLWLIGVLHLVSGGLFLLREAHIPSFLLWVVLPLRYTVKNQRLARHFLFAPKGDKCGFGIPENFHYFLASHEVLKQC